MVSILITLAVFAVLGCAVWQFMLQPAITKGHRGENNAVFIIAVMAVAFIARAICAVIYKGHSTDMNCFTAWSDMIFNDGISKFYQSEAFHDYPPGYMYILYILGAIKHIFNPQGGGLYLLIKFPSIVIDLISGFFIYKLAKKKFSDGISSLFAALYLFNPAVILNSSLWGQVDTVYTILIALMIYLISEKKLIPSYFVFALCIFVKPQSFIFTPLLVYGIIENIFLPKLDKKALVKNLLYGLGAILMMVVISLPFGLKNVIDQYKATLASYPYLTVNAFNIWGALGKNWTGLNSATTVLGYVLLAVIVAYSAYVFFKSKNKGKYFLVGALLSFSTFMLSTKMHDRYAFPTMMLLLMTFLTTESVKDYFLYLTITLSQFFNTAWVLFIYETDINAYFKSPVINVASIINIAIFVYMIYVTQKHYVNYTPIEKAVAEKVNTKKPKKGAASAKTAPSAPKKSVSFTLSSVFSKITRFDVIAMVVITAVYACIALYDLGDMQAPETEISLPEKAVTIDLGKDTDISKIKFFLGSYELNDSRAINIEFRNSSNAVVSSDKYDSGAVFFWSEKDINKTAQYITLSTTADKLTIKEFAVMDNSGSYVTPTNASDASIANLFDEQSIIPERQTFRNSTYFDEIYHARTGYEFVHHLSVYEWTHPPLGKVFIALGIVLFGMCPFGWRIVGTVFGIFMIPFIYLFAKRLTNKSWLSVVMCLLFTFDFMHFAQTRIATIDVYITTFVILMYYFMFKYYSTSFYDTPFKKTLKPLALSGFFMGLGIASKWTGIYAGAGLAVLFFITIYKRYSEYLYAVKHPTGETNGIKHKFIVDNFKPYLIKTFIWCCIFFILVPLAIYCLAYIPYLQAPDANGIKTIIENQNSMYTYHSSTVLGSTHPFSSRWYEWIIMKRPIWYYSGTVSNGIKEGISSFGNPLVWWFGIPAFFYMIYVAFKNKDKTALFLVIGYIAQLVFWIPITRLTFIYHYFPCVPFIVLMIGYSINVIYEEAKNKKAVIIGAFVYAALVIVLFAMFYPVLSGQPVSTDYVQTFLKWFDSWVLI
jgi:Gpi18-like mannosyltransferase